MKNPLIIGVLYLLSAVAWLVTPAQAQMATADEVRVVAQNWVNVVIRETGSWGGATSASVEAVMDLEFGGETIAYFCQVSPSGFIVSSLRHELSPIKAYSESCTPDPEDEFGLMELLKTKIDQTLRAIERELGLIEKVQTGDLESLTGSDHRTSWELLYNSSETVEFDREVNVRDYQEGEVLLSSHWDQFEPYNQNCPDSGCVTSCGTNQNCVVGCVATAGSQILRYWAWPPTPINGFNWPLMPDQFIGCTWDPAEADAVATLCSAVGTRVDMSYTCERSSAATADMRDAFPFYRYSSGCTIRERKDYTATEWFDLIKAEINQNSPIQYEIPGHAIVIDGWQTPSGLGRYYHANYGGGITIQNPEPQGCDCWYELDNLYVDPTNEFDLDKEKMIIWILPAPSMYESLSGDYYPLSPTFNWRYFNQDATGGNVTFFGTQRLQFLHGIKVTCNGSQGDRILFRGHNGSPDISMTLFTRGDESRGVHLTGGELRLSPSGSIRLR